ncbi:hypothetical protein ANCDUO_22890 [Ancylostoma duodenale]|uniref:Uncharacterized protein n=1 Tax=Ancylostoma duodenale TaxID=51022 RepID=A0A0C2FEQ4_9BILA|nr:hypothetical protein ANCDUO_22890 [Ancylostoma duodenale]
MQVRVLKWPGDERSTGCSSEALADCLYLRVTLPKKNEDGNDVSDAVTHVPLVLHNFSADAEIEFQNLLRFCVYNEA